MSTRKVGGCDLGSARRGHRIHCPSPTTASNRKVRFSSSAKTATPCPEHLHVFLLPLRPFPWQRSLEGKVRIIYVYIVSSAGSCKVINFPMMQLENSDFAGLAICSARSAGSPRLDSRRARPASGQGGRVHRSPGRGWLGRQFILFPRHQ